MKHTPGPWKTRETEEHWGRVNVHIEGPDDLELACAYQRTSSENKANARLIAAAPDLLEALEMCVSVKHLDDSEILQIKQLLAKAKGEV